MPRQALEQWLYKAWEEHPIRGAREPGLVSLAREPYAELTP
jgi:hypothetical protein